MVNKSIEREQYYGLVKHTVIQHIIFNFFFIILVVTVFTSMLPFIEHAVVESYLQGNVYNSGEMIPYMLEEKTNLHQTGYLNSWAIYIFLGTSNEARYWFDPILSLAMPIILISFWFALVITSVLPVNLGLIRHKIEREIVNQLDKIHYSIYGYYSDQNNLELEKDILAADTREIHTIAEKWQVPSDDIKSFQKAIKWKYSNPLYKAFHPWAGLAFYMRFYYTERYGNTVLGLVYIGAAVLIIIIGMRGLKFIPSTQPSMVFFALGLEFSVLIAYAFTVIYSKSESESEFETKIKDNKYQTTFDSLNSKEIENLLRAFIKRPKHLDEKKDIKK